VDRCLARPVRGSTACADHDPGARLGRNRACWPRDRGAGHGQPMPSARWQHYRVAESTNDSQPDRRNLARRLRRRAEPESRQAHRRGRHAPERAPFPFHDRPTRQSRSSRAPASWAQLDVGAVGHNCLSPRFDVIALGDRQQACGRPAIACIDRLAVLVFDALHGLMPFWHCAVPGVSPSPPAAREGTHREPRPRRLDPDWCRDGDEDCRFHAMNRAAARA
jgi:hypothetical protein